MPVVANQYVTLTHGAEPFLRSRQLCIYSRTSQHFMEPENSLPCTQEPSTGPYPQPDRSNPYHPILSHLFLKPGTTTACFHKDGTGYAKVKMQVSNLIRI
jgi:hypothetical protein